jgi:hypothetical protein
MSYGKTVCRLLHQAARERNADIIRLLLDIVQAEQNTDRVNGLLIAQDDERQLDSTW